MPEIIFLGALGNNLLKQIKDRTIWLLYLREYKEKENWNWKEKDSSALRGNVKKQGCVFV
jgi:hypothetical protein